MKWFLIYLAAVNLLAFFAYGTDKRRAVKGHWRIPESTLLLLAALGGSVGALAGMHLFHHKTRKVKFKYGVPLILVVELLALAAGSVLYGASFDQLGGNLDFDRLRTFFMD